MNKSTAKIYEVFYRLDTVGCYGVDAQGNPWSTFEYSAGKVCAECGKQITRGYKRGKFGEGEYFCSEHVAYQEEKAETREKREARVKLRGEMVEKKLELERLVNFRSALRGRDVDEAMQEIERLYREIQALEGAYYTPERTV